MDREYHRWYSPALNRTMELLIFGHAGARVLAYPTSLGKFYEWEDRGMIAALGEHLERGWIQLYCVDSVDAESWYAWHKHPGARAWRALEYDRYICDEVLPLSRHKNPNPFFVVTGASFGAYHAMNFALRHPEITGRVIAMSGLFDVERWLGGYVDDNVYFNCPCLYLPNEHDPRRLRYLQNLDIVLAVGRGDPNVGHNRWFSGMLWGKGIGNALREWDGWAHDWPWWQQMIRLYIGGHD
jgi:esterase/lipase superfamily enzyme